MTEVRSLPLAREGWGGGLRLPRKRQRRSKLGGAVIRLVLQVAAQPKFALDALLIKLALMLGLGAREQKLVMADHLFAAPNEQRPLTVHCATPITSAGTPGARKPTGKVAAVSASSADFSSARRRSMKLRSSRD